MLPVDHRSTAARRYRTCRPISRQGGPVPSRCQRRSVDSDTSSAPATSCSVNRPSSSPIIPVVMAQPPLLLSASQIAWAVNRPPKLRMLGTRYSLAANGRQVECPQRRPSGPRTTGGRGRHLRPSRSPSTSPDSMEPRIQRALQPACAARPSSAPSAEGAGEVSGIWQTARS
jgi:hypothetical protein